MDILYGNIYFLVRNFTSLYVTANKIFLSFQFWNIDQNTMIFIYLFLWFFPLFVRVSVAIRRVIIDVCAALGGTLSGTNRYSLIRRKRTKDFLHSF